MTVFSWPKKIPARAGLAAAGSSGLLRDSMSPVLLLACWAGAGHQAPSCPCGRRAPSQRRQGAPANLLGWHTTAADLLPRADAPPFGHGLRACPPPHYRPLPKQKILTRGAPQGPPAGGAPQGPPAGRPAGPARATTGRHRAAPTPARSHMPGAPPGGPDGDAKTRFPAPVNPNMPPPHHQQTPKILKIRPDFFRR
eukprot:gene13065-biopygen14070